MNIHQIFELMVMFYNEKRLGYVTSITLCLDQVLQQTSDFCCINKRWLSPINEQIMRQDLERMVESGYSIPTSA